MATHTWVDLQLDEATRLADLGGILRDIQQAREFANLLITEHRAEMPNSQLMEALSIAATVMYSRPFMGGVRQRLGENDLRIFTPEQRIAHEHLRAYRDKHVAHSVNAFEENIPRANYCVERVNEEGITSISYSVIYVVSLGDVHVNAIIELTTLLEAHIESQIAAEETRLLPIVRKMPLQQVLAGGQKVFLDNKPVKAARQRNK